MHPPVLLNEWASFLFVSGSFTALASAGLMLAWRRVVRPGMHDVVTDVLATELMAMKDLRSEVQHLRHQIEANGDDGELPPPERGIPLRTLVIRGRKSGLNAEQAIAELRADNAALRSENLVLRQDLDAHIREANEYFERLLSDHAEHGA